MSFRRWKFLYACGPQDYCFSEVVMKKFEIEDGFFADLHRRMIRLAKELLLRYTLWEGDVVYEHLSSVPSGECDPYMYLLVKQSNNGSTFIVSEVEFPWLKEYAVPFPVNQQALMADR